MLHRTVPNITSASNYYLKMKDDFGNIAKSPSFYLDREFKFNFLCFLNTYLSGNSKRLQRTGRLLAVLGHPHLKARLVTAQLPKALNLGLPIAELVLKYL